jgi:hypothetical protein
LIEQTEDPSLITNLLDVVTRFKSLNNCKNYFSSLTLASNNQRVCNIKIDKLHEVVEIANSLIY